MGSSKEDDEAGGASGGKSKPGVATVENGAPTADSPDLKDKDEGLEGGQNPQSFIADSSYGLQQQSFQYSGSGRATEDDSKFLDQADITSSSPVVYFVGNSNTVTSLNFIRDEVTGQTQFRTQSLQLRGTKFLLDSKINHLGKPVIRLQSLETKQFINLEETEFKNNFSIFQKSQKSAIPKLKSSSMNEWDDNTMSKSILDNIREIPLMKRKMDSVGSS